MPRYIAVIDGEAGAYGGAVPDCPGCTAMGETTDETIANAGEALRERMADRVESGIAVPEPRSADAILASPDTDGFRSFTLAAIPFPVEL